MKLKPLNTPICDHCAWRKFKNEKRALASDKTTQAVARIIVNGDGPHGWPEIHDVCGPHGSQILDALQKRGLRRGIDFGVDPVFWPRLQEEYRKKQETQQRPLAL